MDIGELEMGGKDKSRQPVLGKSRSLKEAARSEAAAEGASKPVRMGLGCSRVGVLWEERKWAVTWGQRAAVLLPAPFLTCPSFGVAARGQHQSLC